MNIVILGSTGSIGTQALEVIEELGGEYKVFALCANNNTGLIESQARRFGPEFCVLYGEAQARELKVKLADTRVKVLSGIEGMNYIAAHEGAGYVINALMGQVGLAPTLSALSAGKDVGLANKETLVAAGEIVMRAARENNAGILPIDSEHCAIWQCLLGEDRRDVERLVLTASGGPFYGMARGDLERVTVADALAHPTYPDMGRKISVDSATMMNKGLELIEARWLFGVAPDNIDIVVHRESIVHSLVQFVDKSMKAQLSLPDMRMCIRYALAHCSRNRRAECKAEGLDLPRAGSLSFAEPDNDIFPELARAVVKEGGTLPAAMNAANEAAVGLFLRGKIRYLDIFDIVVRAVGTHNNNKRAGIDDIISCAEEIKNGIKRHFI